MDASAWGLLPVPALFSTLSTTACSAAAATQPSRGHGTLGQMTRPLFCPGELPAPPLPRGTGSWGHATVALCSVKCVASSSGKHAFIASPTAKHFGHEKYINVTSSFITIFIPHLMLSLCDLHTKYIFKGKHVHFYLEKREDTK